MLIPSGCGVGLSLPGFTVIWHFSALMRWSQPLLHPWELLLLAGFWGLCFGMGFFGCFPSTTSIYSKMLT